MPTVTQDSVNIVPSETTEYTAPVEFVLNKDSRLQATIKEQVMIPAGTTVQIWFNGFRSNDNQPIAEMKVIYPDMQIGKDRSIKITGLWERFITKRKV